MKIRNFCLLLTTNLLIPQVYAADPLVFTSEATIPSTIDQGSGTEFFEYTIKNDLSTDSLTLVIELLPDTGGILSIDSGGTTCGENLKPKESCTIVLAADPTNQGSVNETLSITYSPRNAPLTSPIAFAVIAPSTSPAILQFTSLPNVPPEIIQGSSTNQIQYEITNVGQQTATTISPMVTGDGLVDAVTGVSNECVSSLAANASCLLTYNINASGTPTLQVYENQLAVNYNGSSYPLISNIDFEVMQLLAFLDFVSPYPSIPSTIIAGTESSDFTFKVKNLGQAPVTGISVSNTNTQVAIVTDGCGTLPSLAVGDDCLITLKIQAGSTLGAYDNILEVTYTNMLDSLTNNFGFTVVAAGPLLEISAPSIPSPIDLGTTTSAITFTITNTGTAVAESITPGVLIDYGMLDLVGGTCPAGSFTLSPAASCTLDYTITPEVIGHFIQELVLSYYDNSNDQTELVSSEIAFDTVLPASPQNVYVANSTSSPGAITQCAVDQTTGLFTCTSPQVTGLTNTKSIDFTVIGGTTYGYITNLNGDPVQQCTLTGTTLGSCVATSKVAESYFIKFLPSTIAANTALFSDLGNLSVDTCVASNSSPYLSCSNNGAFLPKARGIDYISIAGKNYAYIVNSLNTNLGVVSQCTIGSGGSLPSSCPDSGLGASFNYSFGIQFIAAGPIYAYIPVLINSSTFNILKCTVNSQGLLTGCVSAISVSAVDFHSMEATTVNDLPYLYISYISSISGNSEVAQCKINSSTGFITSCIDTGSNFNNPWGITFL